MLNTENSEINAYNYHCELLFTNHTVLSNKCIYEIMNASFYFCKPEIVAIRINIHIAIISEF